MSTWPKNSFSEFIGNLSVYSDTDKEYYYEKLNNQVKNFRNEYEEKNKNLTDEEREKKERYDRELDYLVQEYLPNVYIQGTDLIYEKRVSIWEKILHKLGRKKQDVWGGVVYRALEDKDNSDEKVFQFIYTWTKQNLAFTFWNLVAPIWILIIISLFVNSDLLFFQNQITGENNRYLTRINEVIDIQNKLNLIIILCLVYILIGVIFGLKYLWKGYPSTNILLMGEGVIYILCTAIDNVFSLEFTKWKINYFSIIDLTINIYWMAHVLVFFGSIVLYVFIVSQKVMTHSMDYAPIFVYLKGGKIFYLIDKIHYCLDVKECAPSKKPNFIINNRWHSFEFRSNWRLKFSKYFYYFSAFIFGACVSIILLGILSQSDLWIYLVKLIPEEYSSLRIVIHRLGFPFLLFGSLYYLVSGRTEPLIDRNKENIFRTANYLDDEKLKQIWNFKEKEPKFLIKNKLQDPLSYFNREKWDSFYDKEDEGDKDVDTICHAKVFIYIWHKARKWIKSIKTNKKEFLN